VSLLYRYVKTGINYDGTSDRFEIIRSLCTCFLTQTVVHSRLD
jgi:hypothetical protein